MLPVYVENLKPIDVQQTDHCFPWGVLQIIDTWIGSYGHLWTVLAGDYWSSPCLPEIHWSCWPASWRCGHTRLWQEHPWRKPHGPPKRDWTPSTSQEPRWVTNNGRCWRHSKDQRRENTSSVLASIFLCVKPRWSTSVGIPSNWSSRGETQRTDLFLFSFRMCGELDALSSPLTPSASRCCCCCWEMRILHRQRQTWCFPDGVR